MATLNFEQLRKRAKDLKKAHAAGDISAAERLKSALPGARGLSSDALMSRTMTLAQAQHVIAVESGFRSWARLKRVVQTDDLTPEQRESELVAAALAGDRERVAGLGTLVDPASAAVTLAVASQPHTSIAAAEVNEPMGPRRWPPLLYVCCSRYGADEPAVVANRIALAEELINLGADPNAGAPESETVRGYRTALGGAVGCVASPKLAKLLLDAGADVDDGPTLWEGSALWEAVRLKDIDSMANILALDPPLWHKCHALPQCLEFNDKAMVQMMLDSGADPNWTKGSRSFAGNCLHEALMFNCDASIIEVLLDRNAHADFADRDGRTPMSYAVRLNRQDVTEILLRRGAEKTAGPIDEWIGACWRGDAQAAQKLTEDHPHLSRELKPSDHIWLARAAREARPSSVPLLLAGGLNPNVADGDGETALHCAVAAGDPAAVSALLDAGAAETARNFAGQTPWRLASSQASDASSNNVLDALMRQGIDPLQLDDEDSQAERFDLFERAADAVVHGDEQALEQLLDKNPWLIEQRSERPHRATLLHYLGANGFEGERQRTPPNAVAIAEILLTRGADPNALCMTYRGGADQTTMALMTSSHFPRAAGLMLPLVHVLATHGAALDEAYGVLDALYTAQSADRLLATATALEAPTRNRALIEAVDLGEEALARALMEANADVNAARADGSTCLHLAAFNGDESMVDLLLANGADLTLRDNTFDGNPAGWANAGGHDQLAERLRGLADAAAV